MRRRKRYPGNNQSGLFSNPHTYCIQNYEDKKIKFNVSDWLSFLIVALRVVSQDQFISDKAVVIHNYNITDMRDHIHT